MSDGKGGTDTARVTVTISAPDQSADTSTTGRISVGESVTGELTLNPFDPDDWFAIQLSYTPQIPGTYYIASRGSALNGGNPGEGTYVGTYTLSVSLNNRDPVANNDTVSTRPGLPVTINIGLNDSDADNDPLTTTGLSAPLQATVRYTDNSFTADTVTYTPNRSATGTDRFTYQVSDGNGGTDTATVSVTINTGSLPGSNFRLLPNIPNNLAGTVGDDTFVGSARKDDTIDFSSIGSLRFSSSDFTIRKEGRNVIISNETWGTDTLTGIEFFNFEDGQKQLSDLLNPQDIDRGIYRFFNVDTGTHFLSGSTVERDSVINNLESFNFEGPTFKAADPTNAAADTVFRFFNTQTGTHFFTQSTLERDNILDTLPQFSFEEEAYKGYTERVDGSIPLYRFFNTQTGTHFYTAAEAEKDSIIANLPTFNFEGTF